MTKTKVSNNYRADSDIVEYGYQKERRNAFTTATGEPYIGKNLYKEADRLEELTVFDLGGLKPQEQLDHLKKEVKVRIGITKREIFIIGRILSRAKSICQKHDIGYQKWIDDNFDFSYETSRNFVHVYQQCFADMDMAVKLPTSVLYKMSKPSFPNELRQYIFENVKLEEISNKQIKKLVEKYKEGGIKAIEDDIQQITEAKRIERQIRNTFDLFENTLRSMDETKRKIDQGTSNFGFTSLEAEIDSYEPVAKEIQRTLYDSLEEAYKIMDRAKREANRVYKQKAEVA